MTFREQLRIELKLTRLGKLFTIPAGNVRTCALRLQRSGFEGSVEFVLRDDSNFGGRFKDELRQVFLTADPVSIEVSVVPERPMAQSAGTQTPIQVKGLLVRRSMEEVSADWSAKRPLLFRRYRVEFVDAARARWGQHFPIALYTKKSLLAALQAHTGSAFELSSTWSVATQDLPQLFVHLPRERGVSLYDFVRWYADRYGGCLVYDYQTGKYSLAADETSNQAAIAVFGDHVDAVLFRFREADPAQPRVLNSYATSPATVAPKALGVVDGISSDYAIRKAVLADQSAREQLESTRRDVGAAEVDLKLAAFSSAVAAPGGKLSFKAGQRFGDGSRLLDEPWRVHTATLSAHAVTADLDTEYGGDTVAMELDAELGLKQSTDARPTRETCFVPSYPGLFEGLVVSQKGAQADTTWDMTQAEQTRVEQVVVNLPIFSQSVTVPFEPTFDSFNTFRPRARGERVLVALGLHYSRIVRTLSFRPEAVLTSDVCGEQMVFGKSSKSITKMSHKYDGEVPVFDVKRVHESDQIQMTFSEGKLFISVAEEGAG